MQDDWNAPDYMNWEHEKPRNGPFVGLAKVSIDLMNLETCRRSWKYIDFGLIFGLENCLKDFIITCWIFLQITRKSLVPAACPR